MNKNIGSMICASVVETMKNSARQDMAVADYRMIDKSHADVLIAYASAMPSVEEIAKYITVAFRGEAFPVFETCRAYEQQKVVAITLTPKQMTRSLQDAEKMMAVTASTFIDVNDGAEWQVNTNPTTGAKYLARALDEDFEGIVAAHKKACAKCNCVTASANFEKVKASYLQANDGDYVKFFNQHNMDCGTIKQVLPDGSFKIITDEGEVFVVPNTSVTQIIRKDPEEQAQITKKMEDFYSKIFGRQYAEELFKNGSQV